ncbi:TPA: hypothetical protein CPT90_06270 [Candidatus Gastranaerophilales bacterium HUM_3]|jgi:DNA-binding GntR family transcriptional regulator|nr:GntR family transcriptional regulator [Acinetobacter sp.]DAA84554.1 MAG TPA: hypothetical protein CPT90_06270 [Candidatus Gastranaerophilales bacterium HUM_3]DAB08615.1 MAG TPA: hypothetical protein CPT95_06000 [Candidatus Gastranaerophilales bacterium HUM_15]DAB08704.1 MAG TPA: hypothetical protein CPT92_03115 [Candidatus Gastranaerophilales bacterium HUM_13]DAB21354.1 MAG TPA: hypothetical protein CPT94_07950 [Candidatus Gastranaerophilales bacterium HUM_22]
MSDTNQPRQITVSEMSPHVHSFGPGENKVTKISAWLIKWIEKSLESGSIKPFDFLPSKGDLAFHIGVSKGTIQNVFRYVEDCGMVESKQRIGTYIKPKYKSIKSEKLTSKRELACEAIKKFMIENNYHTGDCLVSTRKLSRITGISNTTIRMAIGSLVSQNILKKVNNVFIAGRMDFSIEDVKVQTLVEKTAENLKTHILMNYNSGDRLPANFELAKIFNVSVKTIHDSIKLLAKQGILYTRRGQYGTVVTNNNNENSLYHYEKIELKIRHYIAENCNIGSRLPSILTFAEQYEVSAKTVKKALDNLSEEGYITFTRGRYGGTFVTDIPQGVNEAYKWLALSPEYATNIEKLEN